MKIKNDAIRNRISDFDKRRLSQPINKPAMNNRRQLYFICTSSKNIKSWHKTLSASVVKVHKLQDAA